MFTTSLLTFYNFSMKVYKWILLTKQHLHYFKRIWNFYFYIMFGKWVLLLFYSNVSALKNIFYQSLVYRICMDYTQLNDNKTDNQKKIKSLNQPKWFFSLPSSIACACESIGSIHRTRGLTGLLLLTLFLINSIIVSV